MASDLIEGDCTSIQQHLFDLINLRRKKNAKEKQLYYEIEKRIDEQQKIELDQFPKNN